MSAVEEYRKTTHAWENTPMHDEDEVIAYGNDMEAAADAAIAELEAELAALKAENEDRIAQIASASNHAGEAL